MSGHVKAAIAYAVTVVALIAIGFGELSDWQMATRNVGLCLATLVILVFPSKGKP